MGLPVIEIIQAALPEHIDIVKGLFREYADWLGFDLAYQGFETELATLPGKYAPPGGALLLALVEAEPAGIVAMRPFEGAICEMKRLYARPNARGLGLGRTLIERILMVARSSGYSKMRLDTVAGKMDSAISLYRKFGFAEIPPYYDSPVEHTTYFEKDLL
jgi:putative acetyltransferase